MNHVTVKDMIDIEDKINQGISFFCGDMLATIVFMHTSLGAVDLLHPVAKIILALLVGCFGGFGGLLGKDIYERIKKRFNLFK